MAQKSITFHTDCAAITSQSACKQRAGSPDRRRPSAHSRRYRCSLHQLRQLSPESAPRQLRSVRVFRGDVRRDRRRRHIQCRVHSAAAGRMEAPDAASASLQRMAVMRFGCMSKVFFSMVPLGKCLPRYSVIIPCSAENDKMIRFPLKTQKTAAQYETEQRFYAIL